jgi:hypothetical protein
MACFDLIENAAALRVVRSKEEFVFSSGVTHMDSLGHGSLIGCYVGLFSMGGREAAGGKT